MAVIASILYYVFTTLAAITVCLVAYIKWKQSFWSRRNIHTPPPMMPFGNMQDLFLRRKSFGNILQDIYKELKSKGLRHGGMYFLFAPVYIPVDLEIVKGILVRDFDHFVNHGGYINEEGDPLTGNLFTVNDDKWRNLRQKLAPTFTSGKMKMMFDTVLDCAEELKVLMDELCIKKTPVDIKDVLSRFSTDVIASCAFGIECHTLQNPDSPFRHYGKLAIEPNFGQHVRNFMSTLPIRFLKAIKFKLHAKGVEEFFTKLVIDTIKHREENNIYRKDFMHLLLQLKNRGEVTDDDKIMGEGKPGTHLTLPEIIAQCFVFFIGGFESSSSLNTFTLYEISRNQEIQNKLREEVNAVMKKHGGKLTYEALKDMTYMDQLVQETLRLYPPLPLLIRTCNKNYKIPGESLVIKKGEAVMVPLLGIQKDPEYYPDPEKYDPERFSEDQKASRHQFTWMAFGEGPRTCIGNRFGVMQAKVGLATLVKNYRFFVNGKTQEPLEFDKNAFTLAVKGRIWLDVEKIQ